LNHPGGFIVADREGVRTSVAFVQVMVRSLPALGTRDDAAGMPLMVRFTPPPGEHDAAAERARERR
jgi:hypothetical protein